MIKALISFSLVLLFGASVLGCAFDSCGSHEIVQTESQISGDCHQETDHSKDSGQPHHCTNCQHPSYDFSDVLILAELPVSSEPSSHYVFLYTNPSLESLKRPPVAA